MWVRYPPSHRTLTRRWLLTRQLLFPGPFRPALGPVHEEQAQEPPFERPRRQSKARQEDERQQFVNQASLGRVGGRAPERGAHRLLLCHLQQVAFGDGAKLL